MQEEEDLGGVGVAFGQGQEVEIVVSDVEVLSAAILLVMPHTSLNVGGCKGLPVNSNGMTRASPHLCLRRRNREVRLRTLLRLLKGGLETFRLRTWGCRRGSCGQGGSMAIVSCQLNAHMQYRVTVSAIWRPTLPFRSRKKTAEAMVNVRRRRQNGQGLRRVIDSKNFCFAPFLRTVSRGSCFGATKVVTGSVL